MKFSWRKLTSLVSAVLLVISSFAFVGSSLYYFGRKEFSPKQGINSPLPAPIFDQIEINEITTPWGIKIDRFRELVTKKTPATIEHYYVNEMNSSWMVNVAYSWENQQGNWIYRLEYH